jgi:3-hydroxyacyl-CoA dehydrogenase
MLTDLSDFVADDCILASNTSTLDLDKIAEVVPRAERVIGPHFFIPAHVTKLLEIVPAKQTSTGIIEIMKAMALALNKIFVIAGNCDGFIGNRLFDRFHQEAMYLLEEGATPEQVDQALESWGMVIGPFRSLDMVGNDIPWSVRVTRKENNPELLQPSVGDKLCELGRYGQKTGSGWYRYEENNRQAIPDNKLVSFLQSHSKELGIERREITSEEIIERCLLSIVNEACAIFREGFSESIEDIDLVYVNGYGFPAKACGPMYLAEFIGLNWVVEKMKYFQAIASHGDTLWQPDTLLLEYLEMGKCLIGNSAALKQRHEL